MIAVMTADRICCPFTALRIQSFTIVEEATYVINVCEQNDRYKRFTVIVQYQRGLGQFNSDRVRLLNIQAKLSTRS